jgi:hypothetical protein
MIDRGEDVLGMTPGCVAWCVTVELARRSRAEGRSKGAPLPVAAVAVMRGNARAAVPDLVWSKRKYYLI